MMTRDRLGLPLPNDWALLSIQEIVLKGPIGDGGRYRQALARCIRVHDIKRQGGLCSKGLRQARHTSSQLGLLYAIS